MGSIIYSFLNESLLFDPGLIDSQFDSISDNALEVELRRYRQHCLTHWIVLTEEVEPELDSLRIYGGSGLDSAFLKQAAFYLDTVILADPLFEMTEPKQQFTSAFASVSNFPESQRLDRKQIASAARQLLENRPLVAQGFVKYFPTSHAIEAPQELPLYASENGFEDVLPEHLLSIYKAAAKVRSVLPSPSGLLVQKGLEVGRHIHIDFDAATTGHAYGYNLMQQEILEVDQAKGVYRASLRMPAEPPSRSQFDAWVAQSINRSAINHLTTLEMDVRWSARFGAQLLTRSPFAASILNTNSALASKNIVGTTTEALLNLNLPYFTNVTMERLMAARADTEAFARFRRLLEKQFREIRLEDDPHKRAIKTENAMHELIEIQRSEVDSAIRRLKRKALLSGLSTGVSLLAAVPTSGFSLLGAIYAAFSGHRTYEEYKLAAKENPAYFLWKAGKR